MTIKETIISKAADYFGSRLWMFKSEVANVPDNEYCDPNKSIEQNVQILIDNISGMRQAEVDFEKAHPELNP